MKITNLEDIIPRQVIVENFFKKHNDEIFKVYELQERIKQESNIFIPASTLMHILKGFDFIILSKNKRNTCYGSKKAITKAKKQWTTFFTK